jgi:hypothetical protein
MEPVRVPSPEHDAGDTTDRLADIMDAVERQRVKEPHHLVRESLRRPPVLG